MRRTRAAAAAGPGLGRHAGSFSAWTRFDRGRRAAPAVLPDGQRTTAFSTTAAGPEAEVQPPLVLRAEAGAARDLLHLLPAVPVDASPARRWRCGSCRPPAGASSAASALEVEGDPVRARARPRCGRAAAARAGWRPPRRARRGCRGRRAPPTRPSWRSVDADHRRHVEEAARAVVHPHLLLLVAGQAARRPWAASSARPRSRARGRPRSSSSRTSSSPRCDALT